MNKLKSILCLCLISIVFIVSGCSKNDDTTTEEPIANKEYYTLSGYHTITIDNYTKITADETVDLVSISKTELMVPNNSKVTVSFDYENNKDFSFNNENYINISSGLVLSDFNFDETNIDNNSTKTIKKDVSISANLESFKILGVAVFATSSDNPDLSPYSGKLQSTNDFNSLLYFITEDDSADNFETNEVSTNTIVKVTSNISNNKLEAVADIEVYAETTTAYIYLIIKDSSDNYFLYKSDNTLSLNESLTIDSLSSDNSKLNKITIFVSDDISTKDTYEK